ncbi:MAG: lytic transglycosylase domain-containing protein [Albidovulum sp.]
MPAIHRRAALGLMIAALAGCGTKAPSPKPAARPKPQFSGNTPQMQHLIKRYARAYDIPESLIHRVIRRESGYRPEARNGPYYGLMQIAPQTAASMGYRGAPEGLLDAETNIKYAGKYLRGAWLVSRGNADRAVMWYARGYYYEAKRLGLLEETGLRS